MSVAITGGTGFVGRALLDRALAEGLDVVALTRRAQPAREGLRWIRGDLDNREALRALLTGVEAVIHLAGVVSGADAAGFDHGNATGTLNLIEAAKAEGVQRFVFVSSLSAREPGLSAYGASKHRAEALVKASALDWTIVRPPAIYGPHDRDMFELFRAARWGVVPVPKLGSASLIHVDDLAALLLALLPGGHPVAQRVFEPDDGRRGGWTHYELARAIGWAVGRRPLVLRLSRETMLRAARLDTALRRARAKLTPDRASYLSHPDWVVRRAAQVPPAIWRPRIETREGLKATARWYREQGWF